MVCLCSFERLPFFSLFEFVRLRRCHDDHFLWWNVVLDIVRKGKSGPCLGSHLPKITLRLPQISALCPEFVFIQGLANEMYGQVSPR